MATEKVPTMEVVQAFHAEISSLYELKPPISKAKMNTITKSAIKAIKMYKHVVLSVERFIAKCRPEYKLPGLYVIDSIVRQSRHQYGPERDVFGPRFMRNFNQTFHNLFKTCPRDDKPKIVRVLNLWQRNNVFTTEVIQPLLDMANPNAQLQKEGSPAAEGASLAKSDSQIVLQYLADSNNKSAHNKAAANHAGIAASDENQSQIRFNRKLLDFDYDDDDEDKGDTPTEDEPVSRTLATAVKDEDTNPLALSFASSLLQNPELLKMMTSTALQQPLPHSNFNQQPEANNNSASLVSQFHQAAGEQPPSRSGNDSHGGYGPMSQFTAGNNDYHHPSRTDPNDYGPMAAEHGGDRYSSRDDRREYGRGRGGREESPRRTSRFSRNQSRWSRSRSRSPQRSRHSPGRRNQDQYRGQEARPLSPASKEREHQRERRRRGLPQARPGHLTICSTTLWLGHVPKLVSEADISNAFGEYGTITSIDLIPPRGCAYVAMDRRQDACAALKSSKSLKLQGNTIKIAWAPGKGMKGREYKDYWDVELGASFIPYGLLSESSDFDSLEEGGTFDEETIPDHLKEIIKQKKVAKDEKNNPLDTSISQPSNIVPPSGFNHHMQPNMPGMIVPPPPLLPPFDCPPGPVPPPPPLLEPPPFNAPPLNIPPPPIMNGLRPPPVSAWNNAPLSGANAQRPLLPPHSFRPSYRHPPHSRMNHGGRGRHHHHSNEAPANFPPPPGEMGIKNPDDDPFAPSAYELKAMATGGRFTLPPDIEPDGQKW